MTHEVRVIVDRIEGEVAVLEVLGSRVVWPCAALPPGAVEGAALVVALSVEAPPPGPPERRPERRGPSDDIIDI